MQQGRETQNTICESGLAIETTAHDAMHPFCTTLLIEWHQQLQQYRQEIRGEMEHKFDGTHNDDDPQEIQIGLLFWEKKQ